MYLARNLKYLRMRNREMQKDIADLLSVSKQTVSAYENGECEPDIEKLILLAEHFGMTLDDLILRDLESLAPLLIRNFRFLQKKHEMSDREMAILMGIKRSNLKQCLSLGIENFISCLECRTRITEYFGLQAGDMCLKDLSKEM